MAILFPFRFNRVLGASSHAPILRGVKGVSVMRHNKLEVGQLGDPETSQPNWIAFVVVGAVSLLILLLGEGLMNADSNLLNSGPGTSGQVATSG